MAREYISPAAVCPYYRMEDSARGVKIYCKGLTRQIITQRLTFPDGKTACDWKVLYCRSRDGWCGCPYAMLHDKNEG